MHFVEISTFCGYYLHFVEISTFRGYYPHFVDIYVLRGYYPNFVEISMLRRYNYIIYRQWTTYTIYCAVMELQQEKEYFCQVSTDFGPFLIIFRPPSVIVRNVYNFCTIKRVPAAYHIKVSISIYPTVLSDLMV